MSLPIPYESYLAEHSPVVSTRQGTYGKDCGARTAIGIPLTPGAWRHVFVWSYDGMAHFARPHDSCLRAVNVPNP